MEMTTLVGPVRFVLKGAGYAAWPDVPLTGLSLLEGRPLMAVGEGDARFLVLDHRTSTAPGTAWVEYWRPGADVEGGLAGLFIVSDAHSAGDEPDPLPLEELAQMLANRRGYTR